MYSESVLLGVAASCQGVCSRWREWKPTCTGNNTWYDRRLSEVYQPSKCVSGEICGSLCLNKWEQQKCTSVFPSIISWDICGWFDINLCVTTVTGKRPCRTQQLFLRMQNLCYSLLERYGAKPDSHWWVFNLVLLAKICFRAVFSTFSLHSCMAQTSMVNIFVIPMYIIRWPKEWWFLPSLSLATRKHPWEGHQTVL